MPTTTKAPKPKTWTPGKHHRAIVAAIEELDPLRLDWTESGNPTPSGDLYDAIENLVLVIVEDESDAAWPRSTWRFLAAADDLAAAMYMVGQISWRSSHVRPPASLWSALGRMYEVRGDLLDPVPDPQPRRVPLETMKQLDSLPNQSDRAIAVVWGLETPEGLPDVARVRKIRDGLEEAPTEHVLPPESDGFPPRRPHFGLLGSVCDGLKLDREASQ